VVVIAEAGSKSGISANPNPFSPDGDGKEDLTMVTAEIPMRSALARIYIYDVAGRLVRRLLDQEQVGSSITVPWDGKSEKGEVLEMGMYVLYLEAIDALGGRVARAKGTVVLAKKMR
jgi:flagellar hook assembly protein FlgD